MELQCGVAPAIPAHLAPSASLLDQDALDAPAPLGYALLTAKKAAVITAPFEAERGDPVVLARTLNRSRCRRGISSGRLGRATEIPFAQPVADGRDGAIDGLTDLLQRCSFSDQTLDQLSVRFAPWRESFGAERV